MSHVVLLGDSVFDNGAYVPGEPDVVQQLRARLGADWTASLLAVDGHRTGDVRRQLEGLPRDATHLVVSAGGNDALAQIGVLEEDAASMRHALARLASVAESFERNYRAMLEAVLSRALPSAVCTIYNPRFPEPQMQRLAVAALSLFNDPIIRQAASRGVPVLDLRLICDSDADYANPIEPSARGGEKIAASIARLLSTHDFARRRTEIFTA